MSYVCFAEAEALAEAKPSKAVAILEKLIQSGKAKAVYLSNVFIPSPLFSQEVPLVLLCNLCRLADASENEALLKVKEDSIYSLGKIHVAQGYILSVDIFSIISGKENGWNYTFMWIVCFVRNTKKLKSLLVEIRPFFAEIPKARTAKIGWLPMHLP